MLKTLGSFKRIMDATADELTFVPGIGSKLAESIHNQLHKE